MLSLVFDPDQFSQLVENAVRCALDKATAERHDVKAELSEKLALPTDEAAVALGISPRLLWDLTVPRGPIRAVRAGSRVLYPVSELKRWIESETNRDRESGE